MEGAIAERDDATVVSVRLETIVPEHVRRVGDRVGDASKALESVPHDYCVVLNDQDIVVGRMRKKEVQGRSDALVELVMEPGPSTVRPKEPAGALLERMKKRNVPAVIVTTKKTAARSRDPAGAGETTLGRLSLFGFLYPAPFDRSLLRFCTG